MAPLISALFLLFRRITAFRTFSNGTVLPLVRLFAPTTRYESVTSASIPRKRSPLFKTTVILYTSTAGGCAHKALDNEPLTRKISQKQYSENRFNGCSARLSVGITPLVPSFLFVVLLVAVLPNQDNLLPRHRQAPAPESERREQLRPEQTTPTDRP